MCYQNNWKKVTKKNPKKIGLLNSRRCLYEMLFHHVSQTFSFLELVIARVSESIYFIIYFWITVLVSESRRKESNESNDPSVGSHLVDQEWMMVVAVSDVSWLGLVLWVSFGALTALLGWQEGQEGHPACKKTCASYPERFCSRTSGERRLKGNRLSQVDRENGR